MAGLDRRSIGSRLGMREISTSLWRLIRTVRSREELRIGRWMTEPAGEHASGHSSKVARLRAFASIRIELTPSPVNQVKPGEQVTELPNPRQYKASRAPVTPNLWQ